MSNEEGNTNEGENTDEKKPGYVEIAFMWWLHPINIGIYLMLFGVGLLTTGAFSYAVGLERDALRMVLGDNMDIAHKTTMFKFNGYRFVRERDTPGSKYSPGEILTNLESRQKLNEASESERFASASRVGAIEAKADAYSARDDYTDRLIEHIAERINRREQEVEGEGSAGLDLGYESDGRGNKERLVLSGP